MRGEQRRAAESLHCVRPANKPTTEALKGGCVRRAGRGGRAHGVLFGRPGLRTARQTDGLYPAAWAWPENSFSEMGWCPQVLCPALPHSPGAQRVLGSRCLTIPGLQVGQTGPGRRGPQLRRGVPGEKPVLTSPPRGPRGSLEPVCFCHQKLEQKWRQDLLASIPSRLPCDEVEIRS